MSRHIPRRPPEGSDDWPRTSLAEQVDALLRQNREQGQEPRNVRRLAMMSDLSPGHLSRVLHGGRLATFSVLEAISEVLGVDPQTFPEYRVMMMVDLLRLDDAAADEVWDRLQGMYDRAIEAQARQQRPPDD